MKNIMHLLWGGFKYIRLHQKTLIIITLFGFSFKADAQWKRFAGSIVEIPKQPTFTNGNVGVLMVQSVVPADVQLSSAPPINFSISLKIRNFSELQQRIASNDIISHAEMVERYLPQPEAFRGVTNWLATNGFVIKNVSVDRLNVYASGTCLQVHDAFRVDIAKVVVNGIPYYAATTPPGLPANIGDPVLGINGLQPFLQARKHTLLLNRNFASSQPYLANDILSAYNAKNLRYDGKGQTIAILIDTFPADSDLQAFWNSNQLAVARSQISEINVTGAELQSPEGEETLDVEWTSGIAPGANINVYATGTLQWGAIDTALARILEDSETNPGLRQLTISLGLGESYMTSDTITGEQQLFATLASQGVTVLVSSGDAGSNPDQTGHGYSQTVQTEYQSSDINVTAVGGTTLRIQPIYNEIGWYGSGGGVSHFFQRPAWQHGSGLLTTNLPWRLVPDVSLIADPEPGALLVYGGNPQPTGGTSLSTPIWAGFCAIINEARMKKNMAPLGLLNPRIYPLIGTSNFRDIQSGSNGAYSASVGYDMVTGIGVPNVEALLNTLTQ